jgi:hypothetical protein
MTSLTTFHHVCILSELSGNPRKILLICWKVVEMLGSHGLWALAPTYTGRVLDEVDVKPFT